MKRGIVTIVTFSHFARHRDDGVVETAPSQPAKIHYVTSRHVTSLNESRRRSRIHRYLIFDFSHTRRRLCVACCIVYFIIDIFAAASIYFNRLVSHSTAYNGSLQTKPRILSRQPRFGHDVCLAVEWSDDATDDEAIHFDFCRFQGGGARHRKCPVCHCAW